MSSNKENENKLHYFKNRAGEKYGRLTVVDYLGIIDGDAVYRFKCDCGNELDLPMTRVKTGNTCSCGCLKRDNTINHWQNYRENNNIIGQVFGELTVMDFVCIKDETAIYRFKCSCGNIVDLPIARVKNGTTSSCGHLWNDWNDSTKSDIIGQRFGKLVVRSYVGIDKYGATLFECDCDCGNTTILPRYSLVGNRTHSCGCIVSIGESNIKKILTDANISYKPQQSFVDLKSDVGGSLSYDFGILNADGQVERLVEFDGEQHYKPIKHFGGNTRFEAQQYRDNLKNQYALSHDIPLVRIPYSKRDSMTLDDILGDKYLIMEVIKNGSCEIN